MSSFVWDEQSLRWFMNFSLFTGFHEKLAGLLRPGLTDCRTLCDIGCGAGRIDLYLAGSVERITCVDRSEEAVAFLRQESAARGIRNLTAVAADCEELAGSWDTVLFSFFGTGLLEQFLPRCRTLISVVGCDDTHALLPGMQKRKHSADRFEALLLERKIVCSVRKYELEAGQPFTDREEAVCFIRRYAHCSEYEADAFLTSRLISIRKDDFAYYLPRRKPIAVFTIAGSLP